VWLLKLKSVNRGYPTHNPAAIGSRWNFGRSSATVFGLAQSIQQSLTELIGVLHASEKSAKARARCYMATEQDYNFLLDYKGVLVAA
jgi:hypothetical protein